MKISIYLANLACYTEGRENGRWLTLPMEATKLEKVIDEIVGKNQEHIILDYSAPFEISEFENVVELNKFMGSVEDCGLEENELKAIFKVADTKEEAMKKIENGEFTLINVDEVIEGWSTCIIDDDTLGLVLNETGYNTLFRQSVPEEMIDYIDWDGIYRDLAINDGWQHIRVAGNDYLITLKF